jgi:hypothetical protein
MLPAFAWCQASFTLPPAPGWAIPWKLTFEADRDALFYLNDKFIGRYSVRGPQIAFYLPLSALRMNGSNNVLTIVLAYADGADSIRTLRIEPYLEHSVRRVHVEFNW